MQKSIVFIISFFLFSFNTPLFAQFSAKWGDQGNGTFHNPVLPSDFSDLDAIRVGDDFYAISSTLQVSPGMAVLHSKDLVNWKVISHVVNDLTRINQELNWNKMNSYGKGVWAGSIRYYKGKYWVYFGTPEDGFFMSSAKNPAGPWEPLHQVWKVQGWDDCCSFLDDDGQLYFIATNFEEDKINHKKYNIHLFKMTPDGKSLIMESDKIIHQSQGSEANKLYKINGMYYHYFSEVNKEGRVIMMERAKSLSGPWQIKQLNHVNKKLDKEPNQGGLIQLKNGSWWFFTHHGTGDWEGRAASLLPITWIDGWPIMGKVGNDTIGTMLWSAPKPIIRKEHKLANQIYDSFSGTTLSPDWEWNYQPRVSKWSLKERKGYLRLHAFQPINPKDTTDILMRAGNTITQRSLRTQKCEVVVKLDISHMKNGQQAGLTHFSTTSIANIGIKQLGDTRSLVFTYKNIETVGPKISHKVIWLKSTWNYEGINQYEYSLNGKDYISFGGQSQMTWGSYRGDRIGIYNYNLHQEEGYIDVDFMRYLFVR
ncbi:glycoside hydrolase family 43 protein [Flectobacillus roseus]